MDSQGIPRKINRCVVRAVNFYHNGNGSDFQEIYEFVQFANRNSAPVLHLRRTVLKSLHNLQRFGLIRKGANQKFRMQWRCTFRKEPNRRRSENKTIQTDNIDKRNVASTSRKRRIEKSDTDSDASVLKRFRGDKSKIVKQRKGTTVELPRAKHGRQSEECSSFISLQKANLKTEMPEINLQDRETHAASHEDNQETGADQMTQSQEEMSRTNLEPGADSGNKSENQSRIEIKSEESSGNSQLN